MRKNYDIALQEEPCKKQNRKVGEIKTEDGKLVADIVVSDQAVDEADMREIFIDRYSGVYTMHMTMAKFDKIRGRDKVELFAFYHEVGHIYNGDLEQGMTADEYRTDRAAAARLGKVMDIELNADKFAVGYVGAHNAVLALKRMQEERGQLDLKNGHQNYPKAKAALKEYDARIAAIEECVKQKRVGKGHRQ